MGPRWFTAMQNDPEAMKEHDALMEEWRAERSKKLESNMQDRSKAQIDANYRLAAWSWLGLALTLFWGFVAWVISVLWA